MRSIIYLLMWSSKTIQRYSKKNVLLRVPISFAHPPNHPHSPQLIHSGDEVDLVVKGKERKYTFENFSIILKSEIEFTQFYLVASRGFPVFPPLHLGKRIRALFIHSSSSSTSAKSRLVLRRRMYSLINIIDGLRLLGRMRRYTQYAVQLRKRVN